MQDNRYGTTLINQSVDSLRDKAKLKKSKKAIQEEEKQVRFVL